MANTIYLRAKNRFMGDNDSSPGIDLDTDTIDVILAGQSAPYTPNASTDEFFTHIVGPRGELGGDTYTDGATMSGKTVGNLNPGVFDANDTTMLSVAAGNACEQLVIYKEGASAAASPLICWIDTATGLPVTPNGGDILITWNAAGIFTL